MSKLANAVTAALLLLQAPVRADDAHYQDFIMGDEAVGLGGAYTAIAADPSALWYNPAGMVDVDSTSLSLSANLYGIQDSAVGAREEILPEDPISKLVAVPSLAGFVQALGRKDEFGRRPYALGFTLAVPSYRKYSSSEEGESSHPTLGPYQHGWRRSFEDQTLWVCAGGALRLGPRLRLGAGLVLAHRSLQDSAYSYVASDRQGDEFRRFRTAEMDVNFSNDSLLLVLGAKLEVVKNLFLGVTLRSPSLGVYSTGNMRFARSLQDGSQGSFRPTPEEVVLRSQTRINGEARAGLAWTWPGVLTLAADVSLHLPVSYSLVAVESDDEDLKRTLQGVLLIPSSVSRSFVINANLGAEVTFLHRFSLGLGMFTNFSSSRPIPDTDAIRPTPARVHMLGGSLAFGMKSKHTLTRLGVQFARGSGHDVIAVADPNMLAMDSQHFVKVGLTQTYVFFFLASTFMY